MKRVCLVAILALVLSSCARMTDIPSVEFEESSYTVESSGGELIIPVVTTGIDEVRITYRGSDNWDIDPETGDMTPVDGWCKLVKVINRHPTRELAEWRSGLELQIEPNNSKIEREAYITVQSMTAIDMITVVQK